MFVTLLLSFLLKLVSAQKTGIQPNAKPGCCPLEWTKIDYDDVLPSDAVFGGQINGKKYAFVYTSGYLTGIKSAIPGEKGRRTLDGDEWLETDIKVMRNPNNCTLGWYKTVKEYESDFSSLEAAHGWNFVRSNFTSSYSNYFSSYNGYPGCFDGFFSYHLHYNDINKDRVRFDGPGINVLYVDCIQSGKGWQKLKEEREEIEKRNKNALLNLADTLNALNSTIGEMQEKRLESEKSSTSFGNAVSELQNENKNLKNQFDEISAVLQNKFAHSSQQQQLLYKALRKLQNELTHKLYELASHLSESAVNLLKSSSEEQIKAVRVRLLKDQGEKNKQLNINCSNSWPELTLSRIDFNESALHLLQQRVIYLNTSFVNRDCRELKTFYDIKATTEDFAELEVPYFVFKSWSFAARMNSTFFGLDKKLGVKVHELISGLKDNTSATYKSHTKNLDMSVPIILKPKTQTKVLVFANPFKGSLPVKLVFEVNAKQVSHAMICLYDVMNMKQMTEINVKNSSINIILEGKLSLDAGYHVISDIDRVALDSKAVELPANDLQPETFTTQKPKPENTTPEPQLQPDKQKLIDELLKILGRNR